MTNPLSKITWYLFAGLSISIGLYPLIYFIIDRHFGLLSHKTQVLLTDQLWNIGFYGHIVLGGVALLLGWTQFSQKLRSTRMALHRAIGKIYVGSVVVSGTCGIYIGYFATGGIISSAGFMSLGIIWVGSTLLAFKAIKNKNIKRHEQLMIVSYAACFSAVTLRLWLPLLSAITGEFIVAYRIVAWLSWVPNLVVAYFLINQSNR